MDFSDLFSNGKSGGPPGPRYVDQAVRPGSTLDRGGADKRARWHLAGARRVGARSRWCSPSVVEEDVPDEAVPKGCSSEHERRWRGGTTEAKNGGGLSLAQGQRKA
jgi:hypothetical protein